jgi:pSer/pThr/pTyr-binding forkhead associated (FHA) protein
MNDYKARKPLAVFSNRKTSMQIYGLPAVLGRNNNEVDAYIFHESISRRHCLIDCVEGRFVLQDLGSTYGTEINGTRLDPQKKYYLNNGDKVKLGSVKLSFSASEAELINYIQQNRNPENASTRDTADGSFPEYKKVFVDARELSPYEYDERDVITIDCGLRGTSGQTNYSRDLYTKEKSTDFSGSTGDAGSFEHRTNDDNREPENDPFRTQYIEIPYSEQLDGDYRNSGVTDMEEDIEGTVILDHIGIPDADIFNQPTGQPEIMKKKHMRLTWKNPESGETKQADAKAFPYRIGRNSRDNDLVLPVKGISRRHITVHERDGEFFIVDEDSTNGVKLNGIKIDPRQETGISDGDRIRIAGTDLIIQITEE